MADGPVAQKIRQKLQAALVLERLELEDESWKHAGHQAHGGIDAHDGGETHFNLMVVSSAFEGLSRVNRQRAINKILAEELANSVHALSIKAISPSEVS